MASGTTTLFEESYLRRSLGTVVTQADVALTELVANAWDAGASTVSITIPEKVGKRLVVEDDGLGMTAEEFDKRWRTLRYDRTIHQGSTVEFPPGVDRRARVAYGRNGVGRHAMFCFATAYLVDTTKGGVRTVFKVTEAAGEAPFLIDTIDEKKASSHGTLLSCSISRNLPDAGDMRDVLSARFLYDPEFTVLINGETVELQDHSRLIAIEEFEFFADLRAKLYVVDAAEKARTKFQHGVAFWVSKRLVGSPSWTIGDRALLDGRTKEAKRLTFIVEVDDLNDHVLADWSAFKPTPQTKALFETTADQVETRLRTMMAERVGIKVRSVIEARREQVRELRPLAQLDVAGFAHEVVERYPLVPDEILAAAVDALVNLEDSRSGQALIRKLANLEEEDVEGLNRLLDDWTVRDALSVLDEVGKRIRVVEAIEKLSVDPHVDELHTLHPLVTQTRWLFGPQFDSPHFISNVSLRTAVSRIVGQRVSASGFENPRKRPDLLFLQHSTLSATAVDIISDETGLATLDQILLLELKRGASTIAREEMRQAEEYVEDFSARQN